ncbi:RHS repeat-associated core domain-containing protein [Chryseobacterium sp.]|uniref:RHS repeat domain-containing protein n=1 Tax=Chryseobacterium sp. TaxID=1871047 RepID=UPI003340C9C0
MRFILAVSPTGWGQAYQYKDHLGNIRVSYTKKTGGGTTILEENNYYAFGLKHGGYNTGDTTNNKFKYLYNGKELQSNGNLDYGWRQYMPDLGRWNGMDALSESYHPSSPYAYVMNNPVLKIDPNGMLSQAFMDEISSSAHGTTWTNNNNGTFTNNWGGTMNGQGRALNYRLSANQTRINALTNDGGGGDSEPDLFKRIGNFFGRLFGKSKSAAISAVSVGIVTFEGVAPSLEIGAILAETAGYARVGVWSLPLMLNGDSGFSANSKPISGVTDVPVTSTVDESSPEEMITLFRGVHGKHPDLINAYMGSAIPWGGPATALQHNRGDNYSMFTSWTTSIEMANYSASRRGAGGIILKQTFPISRLSFFDRHNAGT